MPEPLVDVVLTIRGQMTLAQREALLTALRIILRESGLTLSMAHETQRARERSRA